MGETVVEKARSTKELILIAVVVAIGMFLVGFDADLFLFGGTFILKIINVNPLLLGIAATGFSAGIAIFSVVGGYVFDKVSARNGIIISLAIVSLFSALTGFVTNEYELVVYRFMVGFGVGMIQPQISAFLGDLRPKERATLIATSGVMFNLGLAVAPLIFAAYSTLKTFDIPFLMAGITGLVLIAITLFVVPSTYKIKEKPKRGILGNMNLSLMLAAVSYFFFGIAFFAYESYFTPYMISEGISEGTAAVIFSAFGFAGIIFAYPGAISGDRMANRKRIIQLGALLILVGTIVMFGIHLTPFIAVSAVVLFGGGYAIYGNIQAFSQESVEDQWIGTAVGFLFLVFNIGAMIGGPLMGAMIPSMGYSRAGVFALIIPMIVCLAMISFAPPVRRKLASSASTGVKA
jgi:ACS family hexuronate transporter-like MFS transporter